MNIFTLGRTLEGSAVNSIPRIALGSDSALTAQGDLLDEIVAACGVAGVGPERVYSMVTRRAARLLRLREGEGKLRAGSRADLIAIKDDGSSPAIALVRASHHQVEMVMVAGETNLISPRLARRWPQSLVKGLEPLEVEGIERWVRAPAKRLLSRARNSLGTEVRLAGKRMEAWILWRKSRKRRSGGGRSPHWDASHSGGLPPQPMQLPLHDVRHLGNSAGPRDYRRRLCAAPRLSPRSRSALGGFLGRRAASLT